MVSLLVFSEKESAHGSASTLVLRLLPHSARPTSYTWNVERRKGSTNNLDMLDELGEN